MEIPGVNYRTGMASFNDQIIEQFRANDGVLGGHWEGKTVLLLVRPGRDADWERLYGVWRAYWPDAADYETKTDRKFPVAVITP